MYWTHGCLSSGLDLNELRLFDRQPLARYGMAVLLLLVATGLRYLGLPPVDNDTPFITYTPAILLAYVFLGAGAGRLLLAGGAFGGFYLFSDPYAEWVAKSDHVLPTVVLVGSALLLDAVLLRLRRITGDLSRTLFELRVSERKLARSAAELHELYENAPCAYFSLDAAGRFARLNGKMLSWLGTTREEVVGRLGPVDFLTGSSREQFLECLPLLQIHGEVKGLEFDVVSRQGESRRVSLSATVMPEDGGRENRTHCVLHDITELSRAKRRLQGLAGEQRAILDNEVVGILKMDGARTAWKNRAFERMFGYRSGELRGPTVRRLYRSDEEWETVGRAVATELDAGNRFRTQVQMVRKDGSLLWVDLSAARVAVDSTETVWSFVDITPMMQRQQQSDRLAYLDALTTLPNRHEFDRTVPGVMAKAKTHDAPLAVCFLDLDGFKAVNDVHGHAAGDELLREVARRIAGRLRSNDVVYRFGGDEFVVVLPNVGDAASCAMVMQRVREAIGAPVSLSCGGTVQVNVSIGSALYPGDGQSLQELVEHADKAMYQAKELANGSGDCGRARSPAPKDGLPDFGRGRVARDSNGWRELAPDIPGYREKKLRLMPDIGNPEKARNNRRHYRSA